MKYKELTTKSEAEVKKMLEELHGEAHVLALKIRLNQEKHTHKLKMLKKDIARIKTFLTNSK
jgi:ribosomal protein L29